MLQSGYFLLNSSVFFLNGVILRFRNKADTISNFTQTPICIVLSVKKAIFTAGGHHTVGFICALRYKVINKRTDISVTSAKNQRLFAF